MGTSLRYFGDITIPEDKKKEFTQRVLAILNQGGMMELEEVCIFGKQIWLMTPPQMRSGEEQVLFHYNFLKRLPGNCRLPVRYLQLLYRQGGLALVRPSLFRRVCSL